MRQLSLYAKLAAIRKLATETQRCGYVDSETAQAIVSVAGVSQKGRRLGRWLAWEQARTLLQAPNPHSNSRNAEPGAAGDVCAAPRGIVAHDPRAVGDARRPLGVSGFPRSLASRSMTFAPHPSASCLAKISRPIDQYKSTSSRLTPRAARVWAERIRRFSSSRSAG
jgi:hypothetical protein